MRACAGRRGPETYRWRIATRARTPFRRRRTLDAVALVGVWLALAGFASSAVPRAGGPLTTSSLRVPAANATVPFTVARSLRLPAGWQAEVWARVPGARFGLWTPTHVLLVSVPSAGEVLALSPGPNAATPPRARVLLEGLDEPEGLGFAVVDGKSVLDVAEASTLVAYSWPALRPTLVAKGLPDADGLDRLKGLAVGAAGSVVLGVGSDAPSGAPRGVILSIGANGSRHVLARGVHYAEGLAFDPRGRLWAAVNAAAGAADALVRLGPGPARLARVLGAHTAPLGLSFLTGSSVPAPWRNGALLAVHGALQATPAHPPAVLWFPWNGRELGVPRVFASGFEQGDSRWGRPTDALPGPDGSIYVLDDMAGAIYRLTPGAPVRRAVHVSEA